MTISTGTAEKLVQILRDVARAEILPRYRCLPADAVRSKSGPKDLVTTADLRAEARIAEGVLDILPNAEVVGEEAVAHQPSLQQRIGLAETAVIVDPLDGTWNFSIGLPLFGVIMAVVERGRTTFGVLYDPVSDDWISAHIGGGAHYFAADGRRKRVRVRKPGSLSCMTGFLPTFMFSKAEQRKLAPRLCELDRVLSLRCSCHEYRLLSEGRVDFSLTGMLKPWDHAAGELVYREAGGHSAMLEDGSEYSPTLTDGHLLLASDRDSWSTLRGLFEEAILQQDRNPANAPPAQLRSVGGVEKGS